MARRFGITALSVALALLLLLPVACDTEEEDIEPVPTEDIEDDIGDMDVGDDAEYGEPLTEDDDLMDVEDNGYADEGVVDAEPLTEDDELVDVDENGGMNALGGGQAATPGAMTEDETMEPDVAMDEGDDMGEDQAMDEGEAGDEQEDEEGPPDVGNIDIDAPDIDAGDDAVEMPEPAE
jgi:hypothetical protein